MAGGKAVGPEGPSGTPTPDKWDESRHQGQWAKFWMPSMWKQSPSGSLQGISGENTGGKEENLHQQMAVFPVFKAQAHSKRMSVGDEVCRVWGGAPLHDSWCEEDE